MEKYFMRKLTQHKPLNEFLGKYLSITFLISDLPTLKSPFRCADKNKPDKQVARQLKFQENIARKARQIGLKDNVAARKLHIPKGREYKN
jgi:hypothetical protein